MATQRWRYLLLTTLALGADGCSSGSTDPNPDLRSTPTSLVIDGRIVRVSAEIWRDLMPTPAPGRAASGLVAFVTFSEGAPPLVVTDIAVLLGEEHWSGPASRVDDSQSWVARNGPEWPVGSETDIVALVRLRNGVATRVRVPGVPIKGAY